MADRLRPEYFGQPESTEEEANYGVAMDGDTAGMVAKPGEGSPRGKRRVGERQPGYFSGDEFVVPSHEEDPHQGRGLHHKDTVFLDGIERGVGHGKRHNIANVREGSPVQYARTSNQVQAAEGLFIINSSFSFTNIYFTKNKFTAHSRRAPGRGARRRLFGYYL